MQESYWALIFVQCNCAYASWDTSSTMGCFCFDIDDFSTKGTSPITSVIIKRTDTNYPKEVGDCFVPPSRADVPLGSYLMRNDKKNNKPLPCGEHYKVAKSIHCPTPMADLRSSSEDYLQDSRSERYDKQ